MVTFAHLSDIHLGQDHDPARALRRARRVVGYLDALPGEIDAILLTGDIADHGAPAEYRAARELLATARFPVLSCPGNHDDRVAYQRHFLEAADDGGEPVNQVHHLPGATVAMCDSTIPGRDDGILDDTTLRWLDKVLADAPADEPAFVCFHHPPVVLHHPLVDGIRQFGAANLAEIVERHPHVAAVLCGHAHTSAASTFAGRPLLVAPGVVSTAVLPFESSTPIDFELPPAVAFHVLADDRRLTTHFRSL
ncbi:MAG TPA: metallophosphoesterase [Actinophytocola sp.]|jgi:3',5'-cyclic AMP phosphodiesterase CpdA|uniref:metallophosphoesterase n=1 Tax=Actinophytocola sp. TaxID=1872138 RepID=UPI002F91C08F